MTEQRSVHFPDREEAELWMKIISGLNHLYGCACIHVKDEDEDILAQELQQEQLM